MTLDVQTGQRSLPVFRKLILAASVSLYLDLSVSLSLCLSLSVCLINIPDFVCWDILFVFFPPANSLCCDIVVVLASYHLESLQLNVSLLAER